MLADPAVAYLLAFCKTSGDSPCSLDRDKQLVDDVVALVNSGAIQQGVQAQVQAVKSATAGLQGTVNTAIAGAVPLAMALVAYLQSLPSNPTVQAQLESARALRDYVAAAAGTVPNTLVATAVASIGQAQVYVAEILALIQAQDLNGRITSVLNAALGLAALVQSQIDTAMVTAQGTVDRASVALAQAEATLAGILGTAKAQALGLVSYLQGLPSSPIVQDQVRAAQLLVDQMAGAPEQVPTMIIATAGQAITTVNAIIGSLGTLPGGAQVLQGIATAQALAASLTTGISPALGAAQAAAAGSGGQVAESLAALSDAQNCAGAAAINAAALQVDGAVGFTCIRNLVTVHPMAPYRQTMALTFEIVPAIAPAHQALSEPLLTVIYLADADNSNYVLGDLLSGDTNSTSELLASTTTNLSSSTHTKHTAKSSDTIVYGETACTPGCYTVWSSRFRFQTQVSLQNRVHNIKVYWKEANNIAIELTFTGRMRNDIFGPDITTDEQTFQNPGYRTTWTTPNGTTLNSSGEGDYFIEYLHFNVYVPGRGDYKDPGKKIRLPTFHCEKGFDTQCEF